MSYELETKNRGAITEAGFWRNDVSRVRLGELPPISAFQFVKYSAEILPAILEKASPEKKEAMAETIFVVYENTADLPIRSTANILENPRYHIIQSTRVEIPLELREAGIEIEAVESSLGLIEELNKAVDEGNEVLSARLFEELSIAFSEARGIKIHQYRENPFKLSDNGTVIIGNIYEVDSLTFTYFATYVMNGGFRGWSEKLGVPDFVAEIVSQLRNSLSAKS